MLNERDGEEEEEKDKKTKKIEKPTKIVFACTKTATNTDTNDEDSCSYVKGTRDLLKKLDISNRVRICAERDHTKHRSRTD